MTKPSKGLARAARIYYAPDGTPKPYEVVVSIYGRKRVMDRFETQREAEYHRDIALVARAALYMSEALPSDLFAWRRPEDQNFFYRCWLTLEKLQKQGQETHSHLKLMAARRERSRQKDENALRSTQSK